MKKHKLKIKPIIGIGFVCLILVIIIFLVYFNKVNVGKIVNGKAEYSKKIENVTKYPDDIIIEFNNNYELIDNCIMSKELYDNFKNNSINDYSLILKDYIKLPNLSAKESYNIHKAIDLKLVTENTKYTDYFAVTCGFKNKKELLKYTKAVFDLANKEKNSQ